MKIRTKLTVQFSLIVIIIVISLSLIIYLFSANYRTNQFYERLEGKAITTVRLLIEVAEVDSILLRIIESKDKTVLYNEKIIVVNDKDDIIFDSRKEIDIAFENNIYEKIRKNNIQYGIIKNYEYVGLLFKNNEKEFVVIASAYDFYGMQKIKNLSYILISCLILMVFISMFLGWYFSGRALKPISEMIKQVKGITSNNLKARLEKSKNKDELAELAKTFNLLLDEMEIAFNMQKEFVSNVSHELRNPLTVIKSQIDVTLLKEREIKEYIETIESISEDITNLSHTTNSLLLLAQTSSNLLNHTYIDTRIDEILWNARQLLIKKSDSFRININFKKLPQDDNDFNIEANNILLRNAFVNLMENACNYSDNKTVNISIERIDDFIEIYFSDNGIGISNEDLTKIFKPFYRGHNTKGVEGHGIGLSLVKNIINIHKGAITIHSELKKGTTVKIQLPVKQ